MYTSIVVGTDGSSRARAAVQHAAGLAKLSGARLHLVSAYKVPSTVGAAMAPETAIFAAAGDATELHESVQQLLDGLASELRRDGVDVETYACGVAAADAICDVAAAQEADVIVVGDKGMHGARRLLGSVPNSVTHRASCAVLIVPTHA
jgi:nucleotide-binding universal stress UspA family protein